MKNFIIVIVFHFLINFAIGYSADHNNQESLKKNLNCRLLRASSKSKNEMEIVRLISAGADVNYLDVESGETPLIAAIRNHRLDNVKILLNNKANPSRCGCIIYSETELVLRSMYDLHEENVRYYYLTIPLIEAAKKNSGECMLLLAKKGGFPFKINKDWNFKFYDVTWYYSDMNRAPIHYLFEFNAPNNVEKLLKFAVAYDCFLSKKKTLRDYYKSASRALSYEKYLTKASFLSSSIKDYSYKQYLAKSLTFLLCIRNRCHYVKCIDKRLFLNYILFPVIRGTFPVLSEAITVGRCFLGKEQKEIHDVFKEYEAHYSKLFPENNFINIKQKPQDASSCIIA